MDQYISEKTMYLFRQSGAILEGHFLLTSGLHSNQYLEKFLVLQWPKHATLLCQLMADHFRDANIDVVAGPTTGGVILAYEVARYLGVRGIFAERVAEGRAFRRGFRIEASERVLVVDDLLTTGGSVREVVAEVRRLGGVVAGVGVLVDRSGGQVDFGAELFSLLRLTIPTYQPADCPLCARGIPLTKRGSSEQ